MVFEGMQFQKNKKERVICEFEVDLKESFGWPSNLSTDNIIPAYARSKNGCGFQRPGLKTGVENDIRVRI